LLVLVACVPPPCSFNRIDLPPYQSYEVMVAKVTMAMEQTAGFGVE